MKRITLFLLVNFIQRKYYEGAGSIRFMTKLYHINMKAVKNLYLIVVTFLLFSCSTENTPVYQLSSSTEPTEAGSVTQSATEAEEGETITITATANENWVFDRWSGDHSGTENPASILMDANKSVLAFFEKRDYPLSINIEGEGTVEERVVQAKTTDYPHGTVVELTANPAEGWAFASWSGDAESEEEVIEITINDVTNITATFERIVYPLTITIEGEGEVEQEIISLLKTTDYPFETVVELTANPAEGWKFAGWSGDAESADEIIEVTIDGETNITATFEIMNYSLTINIEGGGEVEQEIISSPKTTDYPIETVVELTANPAEDWDFAGWSGNASGSDNPVAITMNSNKTVTASFDKNWQTDTDTEVVEVTNPVTGRTWMDRNLGASRAATSSTDEQAYGDYYQWGRAADSHQKKNSATTTSLSSSNQTGHGSFILAPTSPWDWRSPRNDNLWLGVNGINNPCPIGYRLPTVAEWNAERQSWSSNNSDGAFASPLKLPWSGSRDGSHGSLQNIGLSGRYWSGTMGGISAHNLIFNSSNAVTGVTNRAHGRSVRCIKD